MVTHDVSSPIQYLKGEALRIREGHWGDTMNDMDRMLPYLKWVTFEQRPEVTEKQTFM